MKLVDADEVSKKLEKMINRANERKASLEYVLGLRAGMTVVKIVDNVDAVPVVRCRDCIYFQQLGRCGVRVESYTDPDGFCHLGKKKEEN